MSYSSTLLHYQPPHTSYRAHCQAHQKHHNSSVLKGQLENIPLMPLSHRAEQSYWYRKRKQSLQNQMHTEMGKTEETSAEMRKLALLNTA